jgi:ATP-binding cassette subfamily F protein 3
MITLSNIFIKYGDRVLFDNVTVVIGSKERIGLVGRNGAGKSTLMKVLAGYERPDSGNIAKPTGISIGYLHQDMAIPKGKTVLAETMTAFEEIQKLEKDIEKVHHEIDTRTDYETDAYMELIENFTHLNERFHLLGGMTSEADAERVLKGLGFKDSDFERQTSEFSGGWQMRIELAKMLLQRPDYLLLDEPTNHLDIESILWLENFLNGYEGSVVTISHDRQFLDNVTNRTVEIELGRIHDYKASYSKFVVMREERRELTQNAFDNQQKMIAQKERTINRFMAKATKTKMAQSMKKQLDKIERVEMFDEDVSAMNIRFPEAPRSGQVVMEAQQLSKSFGELQVLDKVDFKIHRGERVAFVGQNGQGKTTLARILIGQENATNGTLIPGHNLMIGYYAQNQSDIIIPGKTLLEVMEDAAPPEMRTKIRAVLGAFLFSGEDVDKKVSVLSGGERARLALACMLLRPFNLLLLDEPTNHLDMLSKDILKQALLEYDGSLIVVSHDREFLAGLTERTIEFRDRKLNEHLGDVNYFLQKRALDNMRDVEKSSAQANNLSNLINEVSSDDKKEQDKLKKKLERAVFQIEDKITKQEKEIAALEKQMAANGFYSSPEAGVVLDQYSRSKAQLDQLMKEWEKVQEEMVM